MFVGLFYATHTVTYLNDLKYDVYVIIMSGKQHRKGKHISDILIADECNCGDVIEEKQENHAPLKHAAVCVIPTDFLIHRRSNVCCRSTFALIQIIGNFQNHLISIKL